MGLPTECQSQPVPGCTGAGEPARVCGGCGAPFEGTQQEMSAAFAKIWRYCPPSTLVFSGHEYASAILPGYLAGSLPFPDTPKAFGQLCTTVWRINCRDTTRKRHSYRHCIAACVCKI